ASEAPPTVTPPVQPPKIEPAPPVAEVPTPPVAEVPKPPPAIERPVPPPPPPPARAPADSLSGQTSGRCAGCASADREARRRSAPIKSGARIRCCGWRGRRTPAPAPPTTPR